MGPRYFFKLSRPVDKRQVNIETSVETVLTSVPYVMLEVSTHWKIMSRWKLVGVCTHLYGVKADYGLLGLVRGI